MVRAALQLTPPRAAAAKALVAIVRGTDFDSALAVARASVEPCSAPLVQALVYGTLRHMNELAQHRDLLLRDPARNPGDTVSLAIAMGLYEMAALSTPPHAVVNETVNAVRALGAGRAAGLVNAVLRRARREGVSPLLTSPAGEYPDWFVRRCRQDWGSFAEAVFAAGLVPPPMVLRVNPRRSSRDQYLKELGNAGVQARPGVVAATGVILSHPLPVEQVPGFAEGLVSVQDEAAQLAASLLRLAPGQRVLDACAAPGGKTGAILEAEPDLGSLVAIDRDGQRLVRVQDNLTRLGLSADLRCADAMRIDDWRKPNEWFDRILLDAPCSATGVIRRHPDVRLRRTPPAIRRAAERQSGLLDALWPLLVPGGQLVYATCSILREENDDVVGTFLEANQQAVAVPVEANWGHATKCGRQVLPGEQGMDGMYYAVIIKAER